MKTRQQIIIDRGIVKPLVFLLNYLVKIAGKIFNINHDLNRDFKRITVCKFKGMGSIIQSIPLLQTLRVKFPNATITFVSTKANSEILEMINPVDNRILLNDSSVTSLIKSFPIFWYRLIKHKADIYIDLEIYSHFSSLIATLSLSKNRFGYYLRSGSYRLGIYTHMMYFNIRVPISQTYLQFARLLNCTDIRTSLKGLGESGVAISATGLKNKNLKELQYIVINVNASDLRIERRWPEKSFLSLIEKIRSEFQEYLIVLTGNKKESKYVEKLTSKLNHDNMVLSVAGKTTLNELISLIRHANLVITNDTGPMHIAFATGSKTIALFGPCHPDQYRVSEYSEAIYKNVYCSPCVHEFDIPPCKGDNRCMTEISVNEVYDTVKGVLTKKPTVIDRSIDSTLFCSGSGTDYKVLGIVTRAD